jgi:hypothetical protein
MARRYKRAYKLFYAVVAGRRVQMAVNSASILLIDDDEIFGYAPASRSAPQVTMCLSQAIIARRCKLWSARNLSTC